MPWIRLSEVGLGLCLFFISIIAINAKLSHGEFLITPTVVILFGFAIAGFIMFLICFTVGAIRKWRSLPDNVKKSQNISKGG